MLLSFRPRAGYSEPFLLVILVSFLYTSCDAQITPMPAFKTAEGSPIVMPCSPGNLVTGDIDKDGKPDLVVACGENRSLTIFKGRGDGLFNISGAPLTLAYSPNELVIGDINNDANPDIVVGSHDSYTITILHGDGKGNFTTTASDTVIMRSGRTPHTHGLGISDVNSDGLADIVSANSTDSDISIMLNAGRGTFKAAQGSPFLVGPAPYPLTIADINHDQHPDVVSTSTQLSSRALTILLGDGRGNFARKDVPTRTPNPWFVAVDDINKDNLADLVVTHSERRELTILLGAGNGEFIEVDGSPFDIGTSAWHVATADINRDGMIDILAAANTGVRLMYGDGKGKFAPASGSPYLTGKGTWHLSVVDVNRDGLPDVITTNLESKSLSVLLGK